MSQTSGVRPGGSAPAAYADVVPPIRPAAAADVAGCQRLLVATAAWLAAKGRPLWEPAELEPAVLSEAQAAGELFVCEAGGDGDPLAVMIVAHADPLFWPDDPPGEAAYLHRLTVARHAAGRGLATRMIDHAGDVAVSRGCCWLKLDCDPRPELTGLYERHGFEKVDQIVAGGFDAVRYRRTVAPA